MTLRAPESHTDCSYSKSLSELKMVNNNGQIAESKLKNTPTPKHQSKVLGTQFRYGYRYRYMYVYMEKHPHLSEVVYTCQLAALSALIDAKLMAAIDNGFLLVFFFFFCCCSNRMMKNQFAGKMYWKIGIGLSSTTTTTSELIVFSQFPRVSWGYLLS